MPRRVARDPRLVIALQRAIDGESYEQIAAATGVTPQTAAADVHDALVAVQSLLADKDDPAQLDLLRVLELQRLDQLQAHCARLMTEAQRDGERLDQLRVIDRALRVSARRDALLGLSENAELPPAPERDVVDDLQAKREERVRKAAGSA